MAPDTGHRRLRPRWALAVPLVTLVMGLLLAMTYVSSQGRELRTSDSARLSDLVRDAQRGVENAQERFDGLETTIADRQSALADSDEGLAMMLTMIDAEGISTRTPVSGPGVSVTLTDALRDREGAFPDGARPDDLVVHQQDVQSVLNALWAGGAQAVQIQDQRVEPTTAPLCIGNTLLLGGRTYSPPYVVTAVGPPEQLHAALDAEPGVTLYRQYAARYGLGYTVATGEMDIAAADGLPGLQFARPAD